MTEDAGYELVVAADPAYVLVQVDGQTVARVAREPLTFPASPLPEGRADGRAAAWDEGFKAGGRWSLLDEEWFEDSQDFDAGDLPPRPPKPANPYDAAPVVGEREEKP